MKSLLSAFCCLLLSACSTSGIVRDLQGAVLNSRDLATVEQGSPAYLLLIDALVADSDDEELLAAAATLNSAYAGVFVRDPARQQLLADKALGYALRAVCEEDDEYCELRQKPFAEYSLLIEAMDEDELDLFYALATSWAGWISAHRSDWNAVADMGRVEKIIQTIVRLDPGYRQGDPYLYLGTLATLLPEALGGKPELGKQHFERAIALSEGHNLMAKVMYAQNYARLKFDRELHDALLSEVLSASPDYPGFTLVNTYAQQQAKQLMETADAYF
jgi:hypothetical protein